MILEGLVTTVNAGGGVNVAPMGPRVETPPDGTPDFSRLTLRPFRSSLTFANLARDRRGVFHVTDDVLLIAKAAVLKSFEPPAFVPTTEFDGFALADCCRFYEFVVQEFDDARERAEMTATVVRTVRVRDFFGLNRAKHAVIEAAILATRTHLLPPAEIAADFARLRPLVEKTGGPAEREAFGLLERFVAEGA